MKPLSILLILTLLLLTTLTLRIRGGRRCSVIINGVDLSTKVKGKIVDFLGAEREKDSIKVQVLVKQKGAKSKEQTVTLKAGKKGFEQEVQCGGFVMADDQDQQQEEGGRSEGKQGKGEGKGQETNAGGKETSKTKDKSSVKGSSSNKNVEEDNDEDN